MHIGWLGGQSAAFYQLLICLCLSVSVGTCLPHSLPLMSSQVRKDPEVQELREYQREMREVSWEVGYSIENLAQFDQQCQSWFWPKWLKKKLKIIVGPG